MRGAIRPPLPLGEQLHRSLQPQLLLLVHHPTSSIPPCDPHNGCLQCDAAHVELHFGESQVDCADTWHSPLGPRDGTDYLRLDPGAVHAWLPILFALPDGAGIHLDNEFHAEPDHQH